MTAKKRDEYVEEVEHLQGSSPAAILFALHVSPNTLARALYRAGRPDLAAPFNALDWHSRKHKTRKLCAPCKLNIHQAHRPLINGHYRCKCGFCKTVSDNACHES